MNFSNAEIATLLLSMGLLTSEASLAEVKSGKIPVEMHTQVQDWINRGLIQLDPQTRKPIFKIDVLDQMKKDGILTQKDTERSIICGDY